MSNDPPKNPFVWPSDSQPPKIQLKASSFSPMIPFKLIESVPANLDIDAVAKKLVPDLAKAILKANTEAIAKAATELKGGILDSAPKPWVPLAFKPDDLKFLEVLKPDWGISPLAGLQVPAAYFDKAPLQGCFSAISTAANKYHASLVKHASQVLQNSPIILMLQEFARRVACQRWLSRGGPMGSLYRRKPGMRLADLMEQGRN